MASLGNLDARIDGFARANDHIVLPLGTLVAASVVFTPLVGVPLAGVLYLLIKNFDGWGL